MPICVLRQFTSPPTLLAGVCALVHEACVEQAFTAPEHLVYGQGLASLNYPPRHAL